MGTPPVLIAGTPRAGRWNHRLLVPPGLSGASLLTAAAVDAARAAAAGENYLSCSREVAQPATRREGQETLVLFGVDVERLERAGRRAEVDGALARCLGRLGEVIAGRDWEVAGERLVLEVPELEAWLAGDPALRGLPRHQVTDRPLIHQPSPRGVRGGKLVAAVAGLALVAAGWTAFSGSGGAPRDGGQLAGAAPDAGANGGKKQQQAKLTLAEQYGRMLSGLGREDGPAVRRQLWYGATGEWRKDDIQRGTLLGDPKVAEFVKGWEGPDFVNPFALLGEAAGHTALHSLCPPAWGRDARSLVRVREALAALAGEFRKLRREAECLKGKDPPLCLELVLRAAGVEEPKAVEGAVGDRQLLPFFDGRDAAVAAALEEFLVDSRPVKELWQAIGLEGGAPSRLRDALRAARAKHPEITERIRAERGRASTGVHRAALDALERFFREAGQNPLAASGKGSDG